MIPVEKLLEKIQATAKRCAATAKPHLDSSELNTFPYRIVWERRNGSDYRIAIPLTPEEIADHPIANANRPSEIAEQRKARGIGDLVRMTEYFDRRTFCDGEECPRKIVDFLSRDLTFLVLAGVGGSGKTMAAAWTLDPVGLDFKGLFVKHRDMAYDFTERSRYKFAELLVVDEVGQQDKNGTGLANLFEVLDSRYDRKGRTILTVNYSLEAFGRLIGERSWNRLRETGMFFESTTVLRHSGGM